MLRLIGCITSQHDWRLVLVALLLGAIGCLTAVALLARARHAEAPIRRLWILASAAEFGLAVWATHFIAMLAFHSPIPISYSLVWTILSIVVGVGLSTVGFTVAVNSRHQAVAGAIVGLALVAIHYVGIQAMTGSFRMDWSVPYVVGSVLTGCALSAVAFYVKAILPSKGSKAVKAGLLTIAVGAIHYMGMTAIRLVPSAASTVEVTVLAADALAVAVSEVALFVVVLGLISAYLDLYLERLRISENAKLRLYVSELEATKLELGIALEAAYAANKTKSAFLAAMSHELRTPLNAIIGFSEFFIGETYGPLGNPRYKSYSEDIHKSGLHLLELINDILDISRLEAHKAELDERWIDLSRSLPEALRLVAPQAQNAGVQLDLRCSPDLPLLWADERRVKQIVLNLLSNSVKFTPSGGSVTVSARIQEGCIEIRVRDTGIGIAEEDLPKAFESFRQIDNRLARKYEGSGLGLPLARHLAELHGASLELTSQPNVGTTAWMRFPASRCAAQAAAPEKQVA